MNSNQLANGPQQQPQQQQRRPTQAEIDKWAGRQAWRLMIRGAGLVAIYHLFRGIGNAFNHAMGGSPSQLGGRNDD